MLETVRLPVADGPDSTLRGWEAADEGGALSLGFQHLPADQVTQERRSQTGGTAPSKCAMPWHASSSGNITRLWYLGR